MSRRILHLVRGERAFALAPGDTLVRMEIRGDEVSYRSASTGEILHPRQLVALLFEYDAVVAW